MSNHYLNQIKYLFKQIKSYNQDENSVYLLEKYIYSTGKLRTFSYKHINTHKLVHLRFKIFSI